MIEKTFPFLKGFRQPDGCCRISEDEDIPADLRGKVGVYIIETADRTVFEYPKGKSRVLYIGKSDDLMQRLREHRNVYLKLVKGKGVLYDTDGNEDWASSRYQYMYHHGGGIVYYYTRRGPKDAKEFEAEIMWAFYGKHRATPVGNGARSYSQR